jgi:hypothetical protein
MGGGKQSCVAHARPRYDVFPQRFKGSKGPPHTFIDVLVDTGSASTVFPFAFAVACWTSS